jgi:hypothetical protein
VSNTVDVVRGGGATFFGAAAIVEAEENVAKVRENLKIAQSRQKSYADLKRKDVSLEVGEHVYLKVSPLRGTKRLHVKGKLYPRYVGPYLIVKRIGKVAYKLELPPELTGVHPVFHVSQLRKCVVIEKRVPAQALDVQETLEYPAWILDRRSPPGAPPRASVRCSRVITPSAKQRGRSPS